MKSFFVHFRNYVFRGLLAIIPLLLCLFVLNLLYNLIDKQIVGWFAQYWTFLKPIPGLGILFLLIFLYLFGLIASNIIGHQLLRFVENVSQNIPLIKVVYNAGKQVSQSLSSVDGEKQAFKKAVLVKLNEGAMVPAFVMGSLTHPETKEEYYSVLIPTAPTPTSGFPTIVKVSQTIDPGWTVEECLKYVVSVGIVLPPGFQLK